MIVGIQDEILRIHSIGLLNPLLADKTTKSNILWGTDAYKEHGSGYQRDNEITVELITGDQSGIIKNRARKALEQQSERTRRHGEVFTPSWICEKMNDYADEMWLGKADVLKKDGQKTEKIMFPKRRKWQHYVDSRRLEITCGEAPYLVNRYDVATGELIPLGDRSGILDRKLRVVNENTADETEWLRWIVRAFQATYGYEFQGDNLLIARVNLLMTFEEYLQSRWKRKPTDKEYKAVVNTIAWNLWQMDGLTGTVPYCKAPEEYRQINLFEWLESDEYQAKAEQQPHSRIFDWRGDRSLEYRDVNTGGRNMKFDFVIGNPPYQDEVQNKGDRPSPIYDKFMDGAYEVSDNVMLIHPARFLFDAGQTSKAWNKKMLMDEHLKVIYYESDARKLFPMTEIKGGVAITLHSKKNVFGAIGVFTVYEELNRIIRRVTEVQKEKMYLDSIISSRGNYRVTDLFFQDFPFASKRLGKGTGNMIASNFFEKIPEAYVAVNPGGNQYIGFLSRVNGKRTMCYMKKCYVSDNRFINAYNIASPKSNGNGIFGEVLTSTEIIKPGEGATDTFISIGSFETKSEAVSLQKYIKSKFLRTLLGVKKVTQDNAKSVWSLIPIQDFTPASDIDWNKSVPEIDRQLYVKYGLDEKEIEFIETHVKEMA